MKLIEWSRAKAKRFRKWILPAISSLIILGASGCRTLSFYAQAARGQYEILSLETTVEALLASGATPPELKARLQLLQGVRGFAGADLRLPIDGHYRKYADLKRPYVVWNVEAAPEFSMEPKNWWYPLVGRLEYRGFFKEKSAREYGAALHRKGYDVHIGGASAYSTLGWFKDPVLNTFIFLPDVFFAETIFHELGHQRVFASGDKDFNEAFATFVGREGVRRWLRAQENFESFRGYEANSRREDAFARLVIETRMRLETLYGDKRDEDDKVRAARTPSIPVPELAKGKRLIIEEMRREYRMLKERWGGDTGYDLWFSQPINNAKLNSVAAYYEFVPGFARLLELNDGNLEAFYSATERLAKMKKSERHQWLKNLGSLPPSLPGRTAPPQTAERRTAASHPVAHPDR